MSAAGDGGGQQPQGEAIPLADAVLSHMRRETRFARILGLPTPATWVILTLILAFHALAMLWAWRLTDASGETVPHAAALAFGWKSSAGLAEGQLWRLVSPWFFHANLIHLAVNGYALYILGPLIERLYGTHRFIIIFAVGGLLGSVASAAFTPMPSVGASGAIFGLVGAALVFGLKFRESVPGRFSSMLTRNLVLILLLNLAIGFALPNVDNAGHIGGLLGGALVAALMSSRVRDTTSRNTGAAMVASLACLLAAASVVMVFAEVARCGGSIAAFEACYRAHFEAIEDLTAE